MKTLAVPLIASLALPSAAFADYSSTVSLHSEYQVRGIGYSGEEPSLGASLDWWNDSGFYGGIYGYTSDTAAPGPLDDNISIELDGYIGYGSATQSGVRYSATGWYYTFPGSTDPFGGNGWNYPEIGFSVGYDRFDLWYLYSWEFSNSDLENHYLAAVWNQPLPNEFGLKLQAGYSFGEYQEQDFVGSDDSYLDWEITLSKQIKDFKLTASWIDTNIDGAQRDAEYFGAGGRFIFGVSRTF